MMPELSVVIPIKNESESIPQLYAELVAALDPFRPFELIFIEDGSTDDSFARLSRLQGGDPRVRVIRFRRNFGQTAAFAAGFAYRAGPLHRDARTATSRTTRPTSRRWSNASSRGTTSSAGWRKDRKDAFLSPAPAVDDRQQADLGGDRASSCTTTAAR